MKPVVLVVAGVAITGALLVAPTLLQGAADVGDGSVVAGFASTSLSAAGAKTYKTKTYKNCTALNKKYSHGVGKPGAQDEVRGSTKPVTNFTVSASLYKANKKSDRDGDGVACEKR